MKFDDWKDNRWMPGTPSEGRGVRESAPETFDSSMRAVKAEKLDLEARKMALMSKSISEPEPELMMMSKSDGATPMVRADSGSGGGGHSSGGGGGSSGGSSGGTWHTSKVTETYTFYKWTKSLAVHTGVPAWKQEVDESHKYESDVVDSGGRYFKMHFGEVTEAEAPNYDWYFLNDDQPLPNQWNNPFRNKFNFFTNNLCGSDKTNYAWPFYYSPTSTFKSMDIDEDNNQKPK